MTLTDDLGLGTNKRSYPKEYMKHESLSVNIQKLCLRLMFVCGQTDKWSNRQTQQKLYAPDLWMQGNKNGHNCVKKLPAPLVWIAF